MTTLRDDIARSDAPTRARSVDDLLSGSRNTVEPVLRSEVEALPTAMARIAGYHLGWWDQHGSATTTGSGKAFRPALTLLCAGAVGAEPETGARAAAAIELVHNFSLLHDDVMDADLTRRHRPAAWTVFGRSPAILAGDALLARAPDVLARTGHPRAGDGIRMVNTAVLDLVDGQHADLDFEQRADVTVPECLTMAGSKTAALLGCACALGALFGDGHAHQVGHLRTFGQQLGLAFQHVDDLLGIWSDPEVTGKPNRSDLRARKKTLPVVRALTSGTAEGAELAELYHRERPLSAAEADRAAELVDGAGGRSWSRDEADELFAGALRDLRASNPAPTAAAELEQLARGAIDRDF